MTEIGIITKTIAKSQLNVHILHGCSFFSSLVGSAQVFGENLTEYLYMNFPI